MHHPAIGGLIAGFIGACLFMAGLSYDTEQPRRRDQHPHHELSVSASAGSAQTPAPNPNPQREEWREESDLEAQWETALWTKMAAMLAGLGTVVAIVGVLFVRDTLNATREANRVAQRAFEEAERPLFFVSVLPYRFEGFSGGTGDQGTTATAYAEADTRSFAQEIEFHNVGTRPAFVVSLQKLIGFHGELKDYRQSKLGLAEIAPGGKPTEFVTYSVHPRNGPSIRDRLLNGEDLYIFGTLTYDDAIGVRRERGFGFISHRHSGLFGFLLLGQEITWDRINDPEISYDRRVEKRS